jgi:hypothetical protein
MRALRILLRAGAHLTANIFIATALLTLVFPPRLFASTDPSQLPERFTFTFEGIKHEVAFERSEGGYRFTTPDGRQAGFIDESEIAKISTSENRSGDPYVLDYSLSIEDGSGALLPYRFEGTWDGKDSVHGKLTLPDGQVEEVSLNVPGLGSELTLAKSGKGRAPNVREKVAVIVIIPIIGLGVAACWLGSWLVDCASDCKGACGSAGVKSFREGRCGTTCTCNCYQAVKTLSPITLH